MMHVAEAGEEKGRVVLPLCSSSADPVAIEAAMWLARAFQSEIESIFVENEQLLELARHPSAREISFAGKRAGCPSCDDIERHFRFASAAFHALIETRARAAEVPFRQRVVRGEPASAIAVACAHVGPWNVVALAEPFTSPQCPSIKELIETVADATGLLLVGPAARRISGPIVLALERAEQLPAMLSVGERLSSAAEQHASRIALCLVAEDERTLVELEGQARLVLADRPAVAIVPTVIPHGTPAGAAEAIRRLAPGLVIGQFGGLLVPEDGDLRPLAVALECPLLLIL